ncbi:putative acyl-CoA thioesterase YneP [Compostibacillus humi]|uniref:Putative acyl-CoA thioesterase YneP n=1 Tax=Compostibacillus humi TaxID=1245525 RepID=A0A8J2ZRL8_9BACI|nr:thioesterase family protein [Compostibacillus humi]GGH73974.1 putative acyl-CoA thioesterase YneP [Compostibacillus humi]HLT56300.1 thioesterase family protein [Bacillota bacterium]
MGKIVTPIEVRYQETDQMGVVYHANYLVWFEIGRTKFVESLGLSYAAMETENVVSPVIDAQLTYKSPIRYGEKAFVETWLEDYDGLRTVYGYHVLNEHQQIAVSGMTKHVIVKKDTFRPISLRRAFPDWHRAYMMHLEGES